MPTPITHAGIASDLDLHVRVRQCAMVPAFRLETVHMSLPHVYVHVDHAYAAQMLQSCRGRDRLMRWRKTR